MSKPRSGLTDGLVLCLFFCSGATALVYEVVWSKYLALMFGSTIQAQTVVLAVFMGGLALGNGLLGRKADRLDTPLRVYGLIEVAIGLYAFSFSVLYPLADAAFVALGSKLLEHRSLLLASKGIFSVALLLPPTVLMGGTLPLLASWLQQDSDHAGRRSARFYSINSLGAVTGAGLAGFYLVQTMGLVSTLQMTALGNVVIGVVAMILSREQALEEKIVLGEVKILGSSSSGGALRWAALVVAFTGAVSMGLEILASRSLAMIFGSSLQSFAIVLMAFILGIGLGSAVMASPRFQGKAPDRWVFILMLLAAVWIGVLVFKIDWWVEAYRVARTGLARSMTGYTFHQLLAALISMIILGVPAGLLGSVLPLLIRFLSGPEKGLGRHVGRLLTWNTMGAVAGVLITGFVLMPSAGLRGAFGVLAAALCVVALVATWQSQWHRGTALAGASLAAITVLFTYGGEGWRHVISSGVFRARETEVDWTVMERRKQHIAIEFYKDAPDATVSVERGDGVGAPAELGIRINGKADASSQGDLCTQLLIAHLPMAARPQSQDIFILGLGSGISGGAILAHPIKHLTIAENCEPIIQAASWFNPWNRGVLTHPLTTLWREDARTILKLSPQLYDIIITQPSNPWMAGNGSVFSREYYTLAASRLKPGGLVVQWFQLYDMHDGIVNLVLRTFHSVFPHIEVWDSDRNDIVILGSLEPWTSTAAQFQALFDRPEARADLQRVGILSPETLLARQLASQATAFAIPGEGPIQSDLFPILEYEAPRAFYLGKNSRVLSQFDERTWQSDLAPADKRTTLSTLGAEALGVLFATYKSVNDELLGTLAKQFANTGADVPPSIFQAQTQRSPRHQLQNPNPNNPTLASLLAAADHIEVRSQNRKDAILHIKSLLRTRTPAETWSAAYFGALAARASLSEGDLPTAMSILELALRFAPEDPQLHYLARIAERQAAASPLQTQSPRDPANPNLRISAAQ